MRAREMHNKLDRLAPSSEDDERAIPDLTLLSPELQDWVDEMFEKIREAEDDVESVISPAEGQKLLDVLDELPVLGPGDKLGGPDLEIPREVEMHFTLAKWHEGGAAPLALRCRRFALSSCAGNTAGKANILEIDHAITSSWRSGAFPGCCR